jgi:hypothetical protein
MTYGIGTTLHLCGGGHGVGTKPRKMLGPFGASTNQG